MTQPPGPLLVEGRLDRVPGGPFDPEAVEIAVGTLRGECGWHIAPELDDELVRDHDGSPELLLPTLRIVDVAEVRDRVTGAALTGWDWSAAGILTRPGGWPRGRRAVAVELRHGYTEAPAEIVGLVAELARAVGTVTPGVRSEIRTVGGVTVNRSFTESGPVRGVLNAFSHVLERHRVSVPTW